MQTTREFFKRISNSRSAEHSTENSHSRRKHHSDFTASRLPPKKENRLPRLRSQSIRSPNTKSASRRRKGLHRRAARQSSISMHDTSSALLSPAQKFNTTSIALITIHTSTRTKSRPRIQTKTLK